MSGKRTGVVSIANTPVQRALRRAKRSTLILLFALGILAGFVYRNYFQETPAAAPAADARQR